MNSMNPDDREIRLNDYIDGLLAPEERRALEAELARDPEYRALERSLREVISGADALPREVPPERDLWPDIERRLPRRKRPAATPGFRLAALAAGLAAVFLAGFIFARSYGPYAPPQEGARTAEIQALEREYAQARAELTRALDKSRGQLAPETQAVLDNNLAIIDGAVRDIHAALKKNPGNEQLIQSLVTTYNLEVDLLRQATRLPASM